MTMNPLPRPVALAAALAALQIGAVHAQSTPAPAADAAKEAPAAATSGDGLKLERIVVTGTAVSRSKMQQSVSVSDLDSEQLGNLVVNSASEALRSIPGLRSESSGGESNANVGVRGIPISAGGARYLQFQEDGMPVLMFGDIAFGTPDTWLRVDGGVDTLQVVRGGSASTLTTGSPGGIINFISKTGKEPGGFLSLTKGLDFSQTRTEFGYGGKLAEKTRFYVGGYYRVGDGGRPGADGTEDGGQIRMNLTHDFKGGFVRFSFKHLDDNTPTFMPTPVRFVDGKHPRDSRARPAPHRVLQRRLAAGQHTADQQRTNDLEHPQRPVCQGRRLRRRSRPRRGRRLPPEQQVPLVEEQRPLHRHLPRRRRERGRRPVPPSPPGPAAATRTPATSSPPWSSTPVSTSSTWQPTTSNSAARSNWLALAA